MKHLLVAATLIASLLTSCGGSHKPTCKKECYWKSGRQVCEDRCR